MKKLSKKLTKDEAKKLKAFVDKNDGQLEARHLLGGCTPATLSRTINRHTAPSPMLRKKLVEHGIIQA